MGNSGPLVLIFGGTGRIGPAIVEQIAKHADVAVFSRGNPRNAPAGHVPVICDVRDPRATREALQGTLQEVQRHPSEALGIVYMATSGMDPGQSASLEHEIEVAVDGFASVVRAVAEYAPTPLNVAVAFVSSQAVVTHPPRAAGYSVGKAAGEQLCLHWARNPPVPGWRFNVLRVGRVSRDPALGDAVAGLADFLMSESSRAISGQVFNACSPDSE